MNTLDNEELQKLVEETSIRFFQKPFMHKSYFNDRLRTTGGRYMLHTHDIELNRKYYQYFGMEELIAIIKHELCHYHLHLDGKGFKHRDRDFKELMAKVGAPRFCSALPDAKRMNSQKRTLQYVCTNCKQVYHRKRKVNIHRYVCGKCRGHIKLVQTNAK